MKTHTWSSRPAAGGVVAACALALAACSSTAAKQPQAQVPSLPASVATSGSASVNGNANANASAPAGTTGSATAARPRITLDMTNTQIDALYTQYSQCMATNGFSKQKNPRDQVAMMKAQNACVSQDPLPPWQIDASNPKAAAFVHAVVQCLRDKGVQYVSADLPQGGQYAFSFGGPNNDSQSITLGLQDTPDCEKQVAAQGLGS